MAEKQKSRARQEQPKEIEDGIGIRLKAARESKEISQSDLHQKTGLSRTVLINYEAGRHKPGTRELRLLCDALEVSPNYLIYGTEEPHARTAGLADTLFQMGRGAAFPVAFLVPTLGAMLGKDDTRIVLSLVEALLKAKDPVGYAATMEFIEVFDEFSRKFPDKTKELIAELQSSPDAAEEIRQQFFRHVLEKSP